MEFFDLERLNPGYSLIDIFNSARRIFHYENRIAFCALFMADINEKIYVRIFPEEKKSSIMHMTDINGEYFSYQHENFIFVLPAEEVKKCALTEEYSHMSQLMKIEYKEETYWVKKIFSQDELFCSECGKFLPAENFVRAQDGTIFCSDDCAESAGYSRCYECGKFVNEEDAYEIEGETYCSTCRAENFSICDHCGEYVRDDDAINVDGYTFCSGDCAEREGFFACTACGDYFQPDEGGELCHYCLNRITESARGLINSYSYKPDYDFYRTSEDIPGSRLYFGAEVEIAFPHDKFSAGIKALHDCHVENNSFHYLKHDSTAGDLGVEVVTMPATLSYLVSDEGKSKINDIFTAMDENSAYKHAECGMHVHLSRAGIIPEQEIKLEIFFQRHRTELEKIAGRRGNGYCNYPPASRDYKHNGGELCLAYNQSGRYRALNWQNPRTLEIRIFDSVVNMRDFYKNLEFCPAVYQYTKTAELDNIENGEFSEFSAYVIENSSRYPHLTDFFSA